MELFVETARTATPQNADLTCYHCHEAVTDSSIRLDEHLFCCEGCRNVYSLLRDNGLCDYYSLEDLRTLQARSDKEIRQFEFLSDPLVEARLLTFRNAEEARVTFHVPSIHCASCIWLLEKLYKIQPGIRNSRVNFLQKKLHVSFDHREVSLPQIVSLLYQLGYQPDINWKEKDSRPGNRKLSLQIGVAGFAFGNIMLFSFPAYFGIAHWNEQLVGNFLQVLNLLLGTITLFYSGRDYLVNAWTGLRKRELNLDFPLALGMVVFWMRSIFDFVLFQEHGYMDSLAGLVFFLLLGKWFQQKTYYHLNFERDYSSYFPLSVGVKKENGIQFLPLEKVKEGDVILLRHEEILPVEGILLDGEADMDYSFVTGESDIQKVRKGETLYCGGRQKGGKVEVLVVKKAEESNLGELWKNSAGKSGRELQASRLARAAGYRFTVIILVVSLSALAFWLWKGQWETAMHAFTSVLIIACPCAVALAIPFTLGQSLRILGQSGFYLKSTQVLETLPRIRSIVFDKTGTLTHSLRKMEFKPSAGFGVEDAAAVASLASCSLHPVSRQIERHFGEAVLEPVDGIEEQTGKGIRGKIQGREWRIGKYSFASGSRNADKDQERPGTWVFCDGECKGSFHFAQDMRAGIPEMLQTLGSRKALHLLSGDHRQGQEAFQDFVPREASHFDQSPVEKLEFIQKLRQREAVMMVGDGLNDAGALQASDAGIVVTDRNNNFTPACDAVLEASHMDKLPLFLDYSVKSVHAVYYAFGLAFLYNLAGLSFAVSGQLSPVVAAILMPLSSVTVVLFGVGLSWYFARKMGLRQ